MKAKLRSITYQYDAQWAGASILVVECQPSRIEFRKRTGYLDRSTANLDEALAGDAPC